jgi:hypothetical protein
MTRGGADCDVSADGALAFERRTRPSEPCDRACGDRGAELPMRTLAGGLYDRPAPPTGLRNRATFSGLRTVVRCS